MPNIVAAGLVVCNEILQLCVSGHHMTTVKFCGYQVRQQVIHGQPTLDKTPHILNFLFSSFQSRSDSRVSIVCLFVCPSVSDTI